MSSLEEAMEELVEADTEAMVQTSSQQIVVAAIDNAAGVELEAGSSEAAVIGGETASELVHAQMVQAAVVAAAREGGGGIQRRVVMVGNTAHLVTIHPGPAAAPATAPLAPPHTTDLRVKEELLSVVTDSHTDHTGPHTQEPPIESELENTAEGTQGATNGAQTDAENNGEQTTVTMIDMSDFRNSEPTYQTLTSVNNGRMTPPGYIHSQYATLTPLQPVTPGSLPPISSIQMGEKFTYSPIVSSANVSGSFTVMQNNSLAQISLASPYSYDTKLVAMGMSPPHYSQNGQMLHLHHQQHSPGTLSPTPYHQNGLHSPHKPLSPNPYDYTSSRANIEPQSPHDLSPNSSNLDNEHSPTSDHNAHTTYSNPTYTTTLLTSSNNPSLNGMSSVSPHNISPHHSPSLPPAHHHRDPRELSPPSPQSIAHPSPILPPTTILHHSIPQHHTSLNTSLKSPNSSTSSNGEIEEINTKELAQRISAELKRYSIPQAIFAQRVLCRSQGTLSDLLRNPKPWSKLKSGRETFRRMFKWLQEPEFQRMSALRLAGKTNVFIFSSCTNYNVAN